MNWFGPRYIVHVTGFIHPIYIFAGTIKIQVKLLFYESITYTVTLRQVMISALIPSAPFLHILFPYTKGGIIK